MGLHPLAVEGRTVVVEVLRRNVVRLEDQHVILDIDPVPGLELRAALDHRGVDPGSVRAQVLDLVATVLGAEDPGVVAGHGSGGELDVAIPAAPDQDFLFPA